MRLGLLVFFVMSLPLQGFAHEAKHPKKLDLFLHPGGLTVDISYRTSPGMASIRFRSDVDVDGNGKVDGPEIKRLVRRLKGYATFGLAIALNGKKVELSEESVLISGVAGSVNSGQPLVLKLKLKLLHEWTLKKTRITVQDHLPIRTQLISGRCRSEGISVDSCGSFHLSKQHIFEAIIYPSNESESRPKTDF